jgi:hypothetical protein
MDLYVSQLLEDLQAAHRQLDETDDEEFIEETIEDMLAESELFVSGENHIEIYKLIGFFKEQFPPSNRITSKQAKSIINALVDLLLSYNISADLPPKLPIKFTYKLLINELNSEVFISKYGMNHIEYCNYDVESCPLGKKYCQCKDYVFEKPDMTETDNNEDLELPF